MSAVRGILANPRYLGYHVSGRTKKTDVLLDPDTPMLGHVTRQEWQERGQWVIATVQTYEAIVDEATWHRVQALLAANTRTNAVTPARRRTHAGVRRAAPSRYPLAGMVICDCCGKTLQGNLVRGHAFYRCKLSRDYPVPINGHPQGSAVRADRLLPHVDAWLCGLFHTGARRGHRHPGGQKLTPRDCAQDEAVIRAKGHAGRVRPQAGQASFDGLEAGIPADVIASRIAATQREKGSGRSGAGDNPSATRSPSHSPRWSKRCPLCTTCPKASRNDRTRADQAALYQAAWADRHVPPYRNDRTTVYLHLSTLR